MSDFYQPHSALDLLRRFEGNAEGRRRYLHQRFERIREIDAQLEAMIALADSDAAMKALDNFPGPLGGLPVVVKDIFDTHDLVTAYGSPIYAGHRPASDATIVTLLRRQGAVSIGKSVSCEFAYMSPSPTRNPCALSCTPGGSSSGSAAAVAAGYAPFAIGSQTGGSTIRPASFCGVTGYKPTFGLLPTTGMKCFSGSLDTVGLFTSGVHDVAYLAQALSGRRLAVSHLPSKPTFGVPESYPWTPASANAAAALDRAVHALEVAGATVTSVKFPPWMTALIDAHASIQSYEAFQALGFEYDHYRELLTPILRDYLSSAADVTNDAYVDARTEAGSAKAALLPWFEGIDALLTPSAPDEAPDGLTSTGDPAFNRNWTLLGAPCVSVPGLRGDRGGPIGIQVIGRRDDDATTLALAAFVESALQKANSQISRPWAN
jgi:Asp-tRNA(Asn)/Glu-tRNA(Gln) amidotransferase A subunit family amidase